MGYGHPEGAYHPATPASQRPGETGSHGDSGPEQGATKLYRLLAQQAGVAVGQIFDEPSHEVPEGSVIRHEPSAGAQVAGGTEVILFVSDGPPGEIIQMASLVGVSIREARRKLEALGLRVGKIRYEFTTAYAPNIVIRQVPADTMEVRQGSRVELVVSKL